MANKIVSVRTTLGYVDGDGNTRAIRKTVSAPYTAVAENEVDVPIDTNADFEIEVPFGSVAKATCIVIENLTGQSLGLMPNAGGPDATIPDGAIVTFAASAEDGEVPFESFKVKTTSAQTELGLGKVNCKVFGDPEAP